MKKKSSFLLILAGLLVTCTTHRNPEPLWTSDTYSVYSDRVTQGNYTALATSRETISSDYKSLTNEFKNPQIDFKFSINGKDNEQASGSDHRIVCLNGSCNMPTITFGKLYRDTTQVPANTYLAAATKLHIKLDMREVFAQFMKQGYFETFNKTKIYRQDFKGVFIAGSSAPLIWDFDNLDKRSDLELKDEDGDGIYEIRLTLNVPDESKELKSTWALSQDLSQFPQYQSNHLLPDALYNLSLEEMINAVEPDSTFRTGKEWSGVWTRDISYSIILAMASQQPEVSKKSLMRKVKNNRIVQDTGTGGAYPVSTDRIVWALAAWELYTVTGDEAWLREAYPIIKNSLEDDFKNIYDQKTGLVKGESSFLDWREQTYPDWMQPADIFESMCLGTNAVHYQANRIVANMATLLNDSTTTSRHTRIADQLKQSINKYLWMEDNGYYAQFLYGRNFKIVSPRSEALGEAFCVLFDIANDEQKSRIIQNTPVTAFGIPCIYPQIPNIPPYHNNGIWPFVQAYWTLACAKAGNEAAVVASMSAIYRPAALFLTSKENFVASTGDYAATQINSDNMLWSLSGQLATTYKVLFGMSFGVEGLSFHPIVPKSLNGPHRLTNFNYRNAVLDIELMGYGNTIKSITLDGKELDQPIIPTTLTGKHAVKIMLSDKNSPSAFKESPYHTTLQTPEVRSMNNKIQWFDIPNAKHYKIIRNGETVVTIKTTSFVIDCKTYGEYQVIAVDDHNIESFASEPITCGGSIQIVEAEKFAPKANFPYQGFSGTGFIKTSIAENNKISFTVNVKTSGAYAIDFQYSNGNGPVNTDNKCAVRTLNVNSMPVSTIVFPQRGTNEWSEWGISNSVIANLKTGNNTIQLRYNPENANMNGTTNEAMIDYIRITKID
jgi:glycogen debranching enzyme